MNTIFDHEILTVYQEAIGFVTWANEILETLSAERPDSSRRRHKQFKTTGVPFAAKETL
jgi:hypothetical protein